MAALRRIAEPASRARDRLPRGVIARELVLRLRVALRGARQQRFHRAHRFLRGLWERPLGRDCLREAAGLMRRRLDFGATAASGISAVSRSRQLAAEAATAPTARRAALVAHSVSRRSSIWVS